MVLLSLKLSRLAGVSTEDLCNIFLFLYSCALRFKILVFIVQTSYSKQDCRLNI